MRKSEVGKKSEIGSPKPEVEKKSEIGSPKSEEKLKSGMRKEKADSDAAQIDLFGETENTSLPAGQADALDIPTSEIEKKSEGGNLKSEEGNTSAISIPQSEIENKSEIEHPTSEIETLPTANSKLQTENMEVHHHPKVEKKGFKEYILEGLMIFVAVTMGFFAENLREKITDNQKIHECMQSMVSDLQSDITLYRSSVHLNGQYREMIDTIVTSFTEHGNNNAKVYFMARKLTLGASVIAPNAKTFEQMKSSGTIRLVSNQRIADSIASYYQWIKKFDYWSEMQRQRINDMLNVNDKIFDAASFYSIAKEIQGSQKSALGLRFNSKLISSDPVLINSVIMRYQYYYGILNIMNQQAIRASSQAKLLIKLLEKQYHLENE